MNTCGRTDIALQVKHDWSLFHRGGQRETVEIKQSSSLPRSPTQLNRPPPHHAEHSGIPAYHPLPCLTILLLLVRSAQRNRRTTSPSKDARNARPSGTARVSARRPIGRPIRRLVARTQTRHSPIQPRPVVPVPGTSRSLSRSRSTSCTA